MLDYNYFGYKPDYGYELYCENKRIGGCKQVRSAVCFRVVFDLFDHYDTKDEFTGTYTLRCRKEFERLSGNYCSLEKPDILKIMRYMRRAFDIKVTLTETDKDYVFNFNIVGKSIKHKFILTFSRVFFEFPYNEMAKDVMRMRKIGKINGVDFTHKSFLEVYNLLHATYGSYMGGGHSLFRYPSLNTKLSTMTKAFARGLHRVQNVYEDTDKFYNATYNNRINYYGLDWDNNVEERIAGYSKNFQILKELKHEESLRRRPRKRVRKVAKRQRVD